MYKKCIKCFLVIFALIFVFEFPRVSILPVLIGGLFAFLEGHCDIKKYGLKDRMTMAALSAIFTLFMLCARIEEVLRFESKIGCILSAGISASGMFIFFLVLIERSVNALKEDAFIICKEKNKYKATYVFGGCFVILLLIWGISLLISYPGIVRVDTVEHLEQAVGIRKMDVLFPFYMTLYLRFCWNMGITIWGNPNAGVALYCATQMMVLALVVSYMVYKIYKCNVKNWVCVITVLYFALIPYHAHTSYTILKDIPYAIGTMLFILFMWEFAVYGVEKNRTKRILKYIAFVFSAILLSLSRANGYYVFLFCLPFILYLFYKRQRKVMLVMVAALFSIMFVRGPVVDFVINQNNKYVDGAGNPVFDVRYKGVEDQDLTGEASETNIEKKKSVSNASSNYGGTGFFIITAQQLGRVAVDRELTASEYERLSSVINVEEMKATYNKDIVTNAMRQITNWNTKEYLSVWMEFGLKYPYTYFIAWRDQTNGYWEPDEFTGEINLDFCDHNPEVYRDSKLPEKIVKLEAELTESLMYRVPLISLLWCNGFIVWITFFAVALTIIKRKPELAVVYLPLIGLWLTLLVANPCDGQFRYVYSFFLCLPLSMVIPFVKEQNGEKTNEYLLHQ